MAKYTKKNGSLGPKHIVMSGNVEIHLSSAKHGRSYLYLDGVHMSKPLNEMNWAGPLRYKIEAASAYADKLNADAPKKRAILDDTRKDKLVKIQIKIKELRKAEEELAEFDAKTSR